MKLSILYEDNHLLVVNKPSGLATMGVPQGEMSLVVLVKNYLKSKYVKPGNVYLGVVSRLDRLASGAIVLARTSKAAARLTRQFLENDVEKIYWAIVAPPLQNPSGQAEDWLRKNESLHRMQIVPPGTPQAQHARLAYHQLAKYDGWAWLEIQLETGRKHQIRVQLAHLGSPVLGDMKYESRHAFPEGIALHARRLTFEHPVRHTPIELAAPVPLSWNRFAQACQVTPPWTR